MRSSMMRAAVLVPALTGLLVAGIGTAAQAKSTPTSGVHFTQGGQPTCTLDQTGSASCTAEVAGLGEGDVTVLATVQAIATYTCENKGGNQAPGQNKVAGPVVGANSPTIVTPDSTNGRTTLSDTSGPATVASQVSGTQAGCPNGNWKGVDPVIVGYTVQFSATQGGVLLFCREGTVTGPGPVPLQPCASGGGVVR